MSNNKIPKKFGFEIYQNYHIAIPIFKRFGINKRNIKKYNEMARKLDISRWIKVMINTLDYDHKAKLYNCYNPSRYTAIFMNIFGLHSKIIVGRIKSPNYTDELIHNWNIVDGTHFDLAAEQLKDLGIDIGSGIIDQENLDKYYIIDNIVDINDKIDVFRLLDKEYILENAKTKPALSENYDLMIAMFLVNLIEQIHRQFNIE